MRWPDWPDPIQRSSMRASTFAVKGDRSFGACALTENIGVEDCDCEEQGESEEQPPC